MFVKFSIKICCDRVKDHTVNLEVLIDLYFFNFLFTNYLQDFEFVSQCSCSLYHWVLPWYRYKKVLFDFLVTDFVLLL